MPNREIIHRTISQQVLAAQTGATTAKTTSWVDTLDFDACSFNLALGATLAAGLTYAIHESDDGSTDLGAAPATSVVDDAPTPVASKTIRVAYVGAHRYCNLVITPGGATDIAGVTAVLDYAAHKPTPNPA